MTAKQNPTSWDLYRSMFSDGDFVVVIDENDDMHWGKIKATETHAILSWHSRPQPKVIPWTQIRFMAHDGFPVKKLMGADGSTSIEKCDSKEPMRIIRKLLTHSLCVSCEKLIEDKNMDPMSGRVGKPLDECKTCWKLSRHRFGDPFDIEPVRSRLYYPGNCGDEWWGEDFEEVLMLHADNGAKAQLFDLSTVFFAEVEQAA